MGRKRLPMKKILELRKTYDALEHHQDSFSEYCADLCLEYGVSMSYIRGCLKESTSEKIVDRAILSRKSER